MQISKILLASWVAALCAMPSFVRAAEDTDAQAKARQALEKKLYEATSQPPAATNPPAVAPAPKPKAKPAPKAAPAPSVVPVPGPDAPGGRPRPPTERPLAPRTQPTPAASSTPPAAPAPAARPAPVTAPVAQPASPPVVLAPTPVDSAAIAKAREALREKMNQVPSQPPA